MLVEADLPDDPAQLQAMLVEARSEITKRDREIVVRDQQITTLRSVGAEADAEIERLTGIIAALQRHRFGARSEQLSEGHRRSDIGERVVGILVGDAIGLGEVLESE